jgi:hypothetical protein
LTQAYTYDMTLEDYVYDTCVVQLLYCTKQERCISILCVIHISHWYTYGAKIYIVGMHNDIWYNTVSNLP